MLGAPKKDYRVVAVSDHASVGPRCWQPVIPYLSSGSSTIS